LRILKISVIVIAVFCYSKAFSQLHTSRGLISGQKSILTPADSASQRDMIDVLNHLFNRQGSSNSHKSARRLNFSVVPTLGYTLSTGFAADLTGNVAFYTSSAHSENLSNIQTDLAYDTKAQRLFYNRGEIWFPDNKYRFVSDIRWAKFPTETYGLGTMTTPAQTNEIDFNYI
jgi:hypothetical protein